MAEKYDFGMVGLGTMGGNLSLNIANHGYTVVGYDLDEEKVRAFDAKSEALKGVNSPEELMAALKRPRRIMLLVPAGKPVDDVIAHLLPHLEKGDILIDGGNSFFKDTERRSADLEAKGVRFIGMGVSGGEYGALHGPSLMPGGQESAYREVAPILEKIAAKVNGEPCVTYIGPRGAGHYVKMVHNGIEYADMALIAETYDLLSRGLGLSTDELADLFEDWNRGELSSYLVEITSKIFRRRDEETGKPLVDLILDKAGQKGTGKWTCQNSMDVGVPTPTICAAVEVRVISAFKEERVEAAKVLSVPEPTPVADRDAFIRDVRDALYAAKIIAYAQGMALMKHASVEYDYGLNLSEIARIWRGGCIIRARLLEYIRQALAEDPGLPNLLVAEEFRGEVMARQDALRRVVKQGAEWGIPLLAFSTALAYFDAYRSERLPANLIQAQRDFFGAHTYRRVDKEGVFHTEWEE
jgi:6-phosphogluconate dehydrogenase